MSGMPPGGWTPISTRDRTPGEEFTYRTAMEGLEALGTCESLLLAEVIAKDSSFDIGDNDFPDMMISSGLKPVRAPLESVRADFGGNKDDFDRVLDYLTEENENTKQRNPSKPRRLWGDEEKRYSGYGNGRFMDVVDDEVVLPSVTLIDLFDLMVESSPPYTAQREYVDRVREGEELEVSEYDILDCFVGEPGLVETVENDEGVKVYRWTGGRLEEDVYDAVGKEGNYDVIRKDGVFRVHGPSK